MERSAWPEVAAAVAASPYPVEVLPTEPARASACLAALGITTRSWLGAVVADTGGLLVDHLDGDGTVFALYKTVEALQETIRAERRYPTPREQALIAGIRRRTFVMFEEQLQQAGDPGADPTIGSTS